MAVRRLCSGFAQMSRRSQAGTLWQRGCRPCSLQRTSGTAEVGGFNCVASPVHVVHDHHEPTAFPEKLQLILGEVYFMPHVLLLSSGPELPSVTRLA